MSVFHRLASSLSWSGRLRPHKTPGGIRPEAHKKTSLRSRVMPTPIPHLLVLPLRQHQGTAAQAIVAVGDHVLKYQKLADAAPGRSVAVHAPTSGTIVAIADSPVIPRIDDADSSQLCIHLQPDGNDVATETEPVSDYRSLDPLHLREKITEAGICGMGGAGFPTSDKLELSTEKKLDLLIINAAECEPYITADEALIRERAEAVLLGAEILQYAAQADRCIIAIENNKTDAISKLTEALKNSSVELMLIKNKYPAGGERQLIQAVSGKQVPAGLLPADIGILLQNTGTAYAAYKAVALGQPCVSRITTLTGSALLTPKNFETLLGVPIAFLFELCGIDESAHAKTIAGGSMMGIEVTSKEAPIGKTTNCLIAVGTDEFPTPAPESACIRCGYCASACPVRLLPQQLLSHSKNYDAQELLQHGLIDCIECGACAYVCPSKIPLVQYYRASKEKINESQLSRERSAGWQDRFQFHQYRIKKAADESRETRTREIPAASSKAGVDNFSREEARQKIADAVARVQARKSKLIASTKNANDEDTPREKN